MASGVEITLLRGDTLRFPVRLKENDSYVDLTGGTVFFTLKNDPTDDDADAVIAKSFTGSGNEVWVELTPSETDGLLNQDETEKIYYGDVQIKLSNGRIYSAYTNVWVLNDRTRRTS